MKEFIAISTIGERSRMMQIFELNDINYEVKVVSDDSISGTALSDYEGIIGNSKCIYVFYVAEPDWERAKDICRCCQHFFKFVTHKVSGAANA